MAVSLESAKNLYACSSPAGPINLSGFHQNDGHDVEQQAHKMHSYRPSILSRSSIDLNSIAKVDEKIRVPKKIKLKRGNDLPTNLTHWVDD